MPTTNLLQLAEIAAQISRNVQLLAKSLKKNFTLFHVYHVISANVIRSILKAFTAKNLV